jgi:SAM-dependent methyltransferase
MDDTHAGQAIYTPAVLAIYDLFVLGISNHFIWRCPTHRLLAHYNQHISAAHLDVGVGTGYFLDRCRFPVDPPRLALFDLSPHSLARTARRVRRYKPAVYRGDVLKPPPIEPDSFASIGLNYLLHCLPGTIRTKGIVFDHLKPLLQPGGVIFGSTILNGGVQHSRVSNWLMEAYNRRGTFSNREDDLEGLRDVLAARWTHHEVETCGRVALFAARD